MALNQGIVYEIRADATPGNVNGGGFNPTASGTPFNQQTGAEVRITTGATVGAGTTLLFLGASASLVGNIAQVLGGTNFVPGFFEITAASAGVSIDFDRTVATGIGANGTINIGGAFSLGSADGAIFNLATTASTSGTKFYVRNGTYSVNGTLSITSAGTPAYYHSIIGYNATRDDVCLGDNRPLFNSDATTNVIVPSTNWNLSNLRINATGATTIVYMASGGRVVNVKATNLNTAANTYAFRALNSNTSYLACEGVALRGYGAGVDINISNADFIGCHFHSSNIGINNSGSGAGVRVINCLIESNVAVGINLTGTAAFTVTGCTLFNGTTIPNGTAISAGNSQLLNVYNTIIYGFVTGLRHASVSQTSCYEDYNNYFNNTTDVVNFTKGLNTLNLDPGFTDVTVLSGTAAVIASNSLTQAATDFSGVVNGQDYLRIVGGPGVPAGMYMITAHATGIQTFPLLSNSGTANKTWRITTGRNFNIGTNLKGMGYPGAFGIPTTGYMDIGAVQRQETASGGGTGSTVAGYSRGRVVNRGAP